MSSTSDMMRADDVTVLSLLTGLSIGVVKYSSHVNSVAQSGATLVIFAAEVAIVVAILMDRTQRGRRRFQSLVFIWLSLALFLAFFFGQAVSLAGQLGLTP